MINDEQKAFELLKKTDRFKSRVLNNIIGDGVMASFNTVSDAVNAAIKIQQACNDKKIFNYVSVFNWVNFFLKQ